MTMPLTDWIEGVERVPPVSVHFATIDGTELIAHTDALVDDLARRVMEAKTSRAYLGSGSV